MAVQTESGLCVPDELCPVEGHVLCAAGGRHPGQGELYNAHEGVCVEEEYRHE